MAVKKSQEKRGGFNSKIGFILATTGSAIGLGNIWKFPYLAGKNGGGAFLLVYIILMITVGIPLILGEFAIGRAHRSSAVGAFEAIHKKFGFIGYMGLAATFFMCCVYYVIGGWVAKYFFSFFTLYKTESAEQAFQNFTQSAWRPLPWLILFGIITAAIVLLGIQKGIERIGKIAMPLLVIFMVLLAIGAMFLPGAAEGIAYYLIPDFSQITPQVIVHAIGQVLLSLSIGFGTLITFASYLGKKENMPRASLWVALLDFLIAFVAGLAIIPAVFSFGYQPQQGPGLMFITLTEVFNQLPAGMFIGALFFALVLVAAVTSSITLLETLAAYFIDNHGWSRAKAVIIPTLCVLPLSIFCSFSLGQDRLHIGGISLFDITDGFVSNLLLPLTALASCIFIGWIWKRDAAIKEITNDGSLKVKTKSLWFYFIKYIAPVMIILVLVSSLYEHKAQ